MSDIINQEKWYGESWES